MENNIKTKLKNRIDEKGYKQRFIASKIGISETTLSKIVNGKIKPNYKTALEIAKLLGCKPDDIFFEEINLSEVNEHI
jgi:DNA-binding XRE family transcriptional regulator